MAKLRRLRELLPHLKEGRYRLGNHAARHMIQEGFTELDILNALTWGRELALYPEDQRILVLGYIAIPPRLRLPLHIVLEYATPRWVDIVTAFIPRHPYQVYSRARLTALLHYEGDEEELVWIKALKDSSKGG